MTSGPAWLEVWVDSAGTEYVLLLRGRPDGQLGLVDPQRSGEGVATFRTYEEAVHWLGEDEHDLVRGRMAMNGSGSAR